MKSPVKSFVFTIILILGLLFNPVISATAAPVSAVPAQSTTEQVIESAFDYLSTQMNPDGGIPWFDETSSVAVTLRAVLAMAATDTSQDRLVNAEGLRPIDYLAAEGLSWVNQEETDAPGFSVARAGQLLTAIAAANADPHQFGEPATDLIYLLNQQYDSNTGIYGSATTDNVTDQIWAILGLAANNFPVPMEAAAWLANAQDEEGRWNDGFGSYLDTTPYAMLALAATGEYDIDSDVMVAAIDYMQSNQNHEGGWQSEWDTTTNASTTGAMLQAIAALSDLPMSDNWQLEGGNPNSALLALQQDNGTIGGDYANTYSTTDALLGLSGQPLYMLGDLVQASDAYNYLFASEGSDGGWESVGQTLDVILAVRAAGWQPETLQIETNSPLTYLNANLETYLESGPDAIGKAILGAIAVGENPSDFNGLNLPELLLSQYDETAQAFGDPGNTWNQALPILGLFAVGEEIPAGVVDTLISLQEDDFGWEYSDGFGSWPDTTALAVQALLVSGVDPDDPIIESAVDFFRTTQNEDGGWGDSTTTAYVVMALNALGESMTDWRTTSAGDPLTSLMSYQKANGSFVYSWEYSDDSVMSTASALLALFGEDYILQSDGTAAENTAAIIIDPGEGEAQTACVQFSEDSISGLTLLDSSGFEYDNSEGFIGSINGISNADGETNYWSYWAWNGQEWTFQNSGANDSVVLPGSVEAWHFTSWEVFPSLPPDTLPVLSSICETGELLKDFNVEPNLAYSDLYNDVVSSFVPAEPGEITVEPTVDATEESAGEVEPTVVEQTEAAPDTTESETLSVIPFIILGGLAVVILVVVLGNSKKNKK